MYRVTSLRPVNRATSVCDNSDGSAAQQGFDGSYDVFVRPATGQVGASGGCDSAQLCGDLRTGVLEHVDTLAAPLSADVDSTGSFNARRSLDGCSAVFVSLNLVSKPG